MTGLFKAIATAALISFATSGLSDDVVLTVTGDTAPSEQGDVWTFNLNALQMLPETTFETTTIWTDGVQAFEGISLADLMSHVGARQGEILAVALNDYAVKIPTSDAVKGGAIIAYRRGGAEMSIRDRGPLWVVYPFDGNEKYKSEEYYSRSIWQLDRIEFIAQN